MLKIKFECWWTNSESINNRIIKQFINSDDRKNYELVTEGQDYTIILGNTNFNELNTKKNNTFYISQEPLWSPNEPKDHIHDFCSKILVADKRSYPNKAEYIETLLPMLYAGRGENDYREEWDWSTTIKNKNYEKNKTISVIVRKDYGGHYQSQSIPEISEVLYEYRTKLTEKLSFIEKIDIFGTHWEANNINIKGEIWNKHVGLDDYRFSFCFENSNQKNYISEKFWDSILTDTIPIYLGCNNINQHIKGNSFIPINNLTDDQIIDLTNNIITNDKEIYENMISNVKKLKYDFFNNPKYNLWEKVKEMINEK